MTERNGLEQLSLQDIAFDDRGLVPAVVQDTRTGEVLMLAYMNRESLARTVETGETWFYSRSRQQLWHKGESSGNRQRVRWLRVDCDADTLLVGVEQQGAGACHVEGHRSCFWRGLDGLASGDPESFEVLPELDRVIASRQAEMPEGSYTSRLFRSGVDRVAKKVGEEAVEVILAAKNHARSPGGEMAAETADLVYHLLVLARLVGLESSELFRELARRRGSGTSGRDTKKVR